jgi:hypothetical protein
LTKCVSEKFPWKSVSRRTSFQDAADRDISSRFVAFSARTTSKQRGTLAWKDEYTGYRVDSFVMAKISKISLDSISCGGLEEGARTIRLAITRLGTVALSKRITKTISLKTITFR